jgi:hypothetical protein
MLKSEGIIKLLMFTSIKCVFAILFFMFSCMFFGYF